MQFSLEIVPPSSSDKVSAYNEMLSGLAHLNPASVSVTLGAGQTTSAVEESLTTLNQVQNQIKVPAVAHLTGLYRTKQEVTAFLNHLTEINVTQVLALRGDYQANKPVGEFLHASDLITYIKSQGDFTVSAACYPAGHLESGSADEEFKYLKLKVVSGAKKLISQVFLDNQVFYDFSSRADKAGINVPIIAGMMPILSPHLVTILTDKMKLPLNKSIEQIVARYGNDPAAFRQAGLEFTRRQIDDLQKHGVAGIHLFTMNDLAASEFLLGKH